MKRILFCLLVLATFFHPTNTYATGTTPGIAQKKFTAQQEDLQKNTNDYLYSEALEPLEDDTNDPEDEICAFGLSASGNYYLLSHDYYRFCLKRTRYTGFSHPQHLPVFIFLKAFRL